MKRLVMTWAAIYWTVCGALLVGCNITLPKIPDEAKPVVITTTTSTTSTTTTQPPVVPTARKIDCPEWAKGGECPVPAGIDIRYDVAYRGDYCFAGDFLAKYTIISRNATGTYDLTLPDVVKNGVLFHCEAWNYPSSASQKHLGNRCAAYDKSGTFRFWIQCYEVAK
jgi:hypothetical protein